VTTDPTPGGPPADPEAEADADAPGSLAATLLAMADEDQRVRAALAADGALFGGYHPRMAAVHRRNAERLAAIMDRVGWPGRRLVGAAAADAAWLVLQHAVGSPAVMRRGLALLRAAPAGEVAPAQLAMLEDRVRVLSGRPQRYGTQFEWDARGELSPRPLDDPAGVDARRRAAGLPPLDDAIREARAAAAREGERPPTDLAARHREVEAWRRAVGWSG
jgi:hypothetical protein